MARNSSALLVASLWLAGSSQSAPSQTNPTAITTSPTYEVATIKLPAPNQYASPLYKYIQGAFNIPVNSSGWVIGPDWINTARYVIQAKPPEAINKAMQAMTAEEKRNQIHWMMRGLLADRFKLKAHFESREMPVYELVVAKGGPKLQESSDPTQKQAAVSPSMVRGKAVPISTLLDMLETVPDIGGRVVVDKTGLSGTYDFLLKWTPLNASSNDTEGAPLFTAIEEQLGLKLVPVKALGQVLVIDHIERPSEN